MFEYNLYGCFLISIEINNLLSQYTIFIQSEFIHQKVISPTNRIVDD